MNELTKKQENSPKRYLYEICNYLGWEMPMFTDPAAGGYRLRYSADSKEEAEQELEELVRAAKDLGINVLRPRITFREMRPVDNVREVVAKHKIPATEDGWPDWNKIDINSPQYIDFAAEAYYPTYWFAVIVPRYDVEN